MNKHCINKNVKYFKRNKRFKKNLSFHYCYLQDEIYSSSDQCSIKILEERCNCISSNRIYYSCRP